MTNPPPSPTPGTPPPKDELTKSFAKKKEKNRTSLLDGIPAALPQLVRTNQLSKTAASVGYDWPHRHMLFDKLKEEIDELAAELFPAGNIPEMDATVEAEIVADEPIADPQLKKNAQGGNRRSTFCRGEHRPSLGNRSRGSTSRFESKIREAISCDRTGARSNRERHPRSDVDRNGKVIPASQTQRVYLSVVQPRSDPAGLTTLVLRSE